ncbi:MAG: GNAT family N-acetyltransferase [Dehalococcoidaceae bacterium]|nr:GNAT family N-acetyltransferase [Dehalococcoidaceae bacterium]
MVERPTLTTPRLRLRPFCEADSRDVQCLAGEKEIAAGTLLIPHPYPDGLARAWIKSHQQSYERGEGVVWAVTLEPAGTLVGAIGLTIDSENGRAELGYWIGRPYWSRSYATEAGKAVIDYGFNVLGLNRIYARHLGRNPASGRVMQKLGMSLEGRLRQDVKKWGRFDDLELYAILRTEYDGTQDENA